MLGTDLGFTTEAVISSHYAARWVAVVTYMVITHGQCIQGLGKKRKILLTDQSAQAQFEMLLLCH